MRRRFDVVVTIRRGDQPAYSHVYFTGVKPGKVERLVADTAFDVGDNISRGHHPFDVFHIGRRATVRSGPVRAVVRAVNTSGR